ncbi:DUF432 domain-containing protein [Candidatus Latescibacterota bacterium]
MNEKNISDVKWWGDFSLPMDGAGRWQIGPAVLWIERFTSEWRTTYEINENVQETSVEITIPCKLSEEIIEKSIINRFGLEKTDDTVLLLPALADRSVVIQSEIPFNILPKQKISYYVSSPLWVQIKTTKSDMLLLDIPIFRPSDTWFGPSTMEGSISYASKTNGRLKLENILFRPHRALTEVLIHNQTDKPILLQKLNLPVTHLSLYESEDGYLWTQPVNLEIKKDDELSDLKINKRLPLKAINPRNLSNPRIAVNQNIIAKTLSHLIK